MHRLIVTSATYRQASQVPHRAARSTTRRTACWRAGRGSACRPRWSATTPWRSPACSSPRIGGPSVKPYQPAGLWEELAGGAGEGPYVQDKGPNLYRRSLYVYRKRTVPHPAHGDLRRPQPRDLPGQAARTNTPLQALELLNDVTYVEAARHLAQLMLDRRRQHARGPDRPTPSAAPPPGRRRRPSSTRPARGLERYRAVVSPPTRARPTQLIRHGESPVDPERSTRVELAAYTATAGVILNLDETITQE